MRKRWWVLLLTVLALAILPTALAPESCLPGMLCEDDCACTGPGDCPTGYTCSNCHCIRVIIGGGSFCRCGDGVCSTLCKESMTSCPADCTPACTPNCAGKQCGSDGCSGSCGTCPSAQQTCDAGVCKCPSDTVLSGTSCVVCTSSAPLAAEVPCGASQGYTLCTGSAGSVTGTKCPEGQTCTSSGCVACVHEIPAAADVPCSSSPASYTLCSSGSIVQVAGTKCGSGQTCSNGVCVACASNPSAADVACGKTAKFTLCSTGTVSEVTITGTSCPEGAKCVNNECVSVCTPSCPSPNNYCEPVDDGCGGRCPAGNYCSDPLQVCSNGECVARKVAVQVDDVVVTAGQPVVLSPRVDLAEQVIFSYSGWMDSFYRMTTRADVGTHEVLVQAIVQNTVVGDDLVKVAVICNPGDGTDYAGCCKDGTYPSPFSNATRCFGRCVASA